jgi:hypothetical protein
LSERILFAKRFNLIWYLQQHNKTLHGPARVQNGNLDRKLFVILRTKFYRKSNKLSRKLKLHLEKRNKEGRKEKRRMERKNMKERNKSGGKGKTYFIKI